MSDRETTDNFWEIWSSFEWPVSPSVEYRLYHDSDGSPQIYTMEDLPGEYILVSQEVYIKSPWRVRVQEGKLEFLPEPTPHFDRLVPDQDSGTLCHSRDVSIVVTQLPGRRWDKR